jgi:predicted PurR-regulated permease PerM
VGIDGGHGDDRGQIITIVFLVYFILISGDLYRRKLMKVAGRSLKEKKVTTDILNDINSQIGRYLLVLGFTCLLVGVSSWVAFRWVGLEQAGVWGAAAGVLNSIPYFGPLVIAGGIALLGFFQFGASWNVALLVGLSLTITTLEGYLLTPWLTSRAAQMNAVVVFIGLLFWAWVWGMWGLLLAVPMLVVIKVVCDHLEDFKSIGELLGE